MVTDPLGTLKAGREHSEEKGHTLAVTGCAQRDSSGGAQTRGKPVGPKAPEASKVVPASRGRRDSEAPREAASVLSW